MSRAAREIRNLDRYAHKVAGEPARTSRDWERDRIRRDAQKAREELAAEPETLAFPTVCRVSGARLFYPVKGEAICPTCQAHAYGYFRQLGQREPLPTDPAPVPEELETLPCEDCGIELAGPDEFDPAVKVGPREPVIYVAEDGTVIDEYCRAISYRTA